MRIEYYKAFTKAFDKMDQKHQEKILKAIEYFQVDPLSPALRNHPLKGSMSGKRAFSVGGDIRVIFQEFEHYTMVLMLDVGSHNQVY